MGAMTGIGVELAEIMEWRKVENGAFGIVLRHAVNNRVLQLLIQFLSSFFYIIVN